MEYKRLIPIRGQEFTLLSGLSTYAHKVSSSAEALNFLEDAWRGEIISEPVYQVGKIIITGQIPEDTTPDILETANYYLHVAKSYQPDKAA
jgi:hypothetical protein